MATVFGTKFALAFATNLFVPSIKVPLARVYKSGEVEKERTKGLLLLLLLLLFLLLLLLLLLLYSFHPIAEITLKNANIKDEFKGASTRIN